MSRQPNWGRAIWMSRKRSQAKADSFEQKRSRFRVRITLFVGAIATASSALALIWLSGVASRFLEADNRSIQVDIIPSCGEQMDLAVDIKVDLKSNTIHFQFYPSDLITIGWEERRLKKLEYFENCYIEIKSDTKMLYARRGMESHDSALSSLVDLPIFGGGVLRPDGGGVVAGLPAFYLPYEVVINKGLIDFMGYLSVEFSDLYHREAMGVFHVALSIASYQQISDEKFTLPYISLAVVLPSETAKAINVSPEPHHVQFPGPRTSDAETYLFKLRPEVDEDFVDRAFLLRFEEPDERRFREMLLILVSVLLGVGVSAMLEAILAGGHSVAAKGRLKSRGRTRMIKR